jgi:hypothetical protein
MQKIIVYLAVFLGGILVFRCESKNEEDLFGMTVCDTSKVTYRTSIEPILRKNCYECHAINIATAGIILEGYDNLILRVNSGRFPGAVNHLDGYVPMPKDRGMLPECDLAKINIWLNDGAPNN